MKYLTKVALMILLAPKLSLKGQGQVRMRGQGKVRMKGLGRGQDERSGQGQACRDMSRQRVLQISPGDGPATKPTNQEPI